MVIDEARLQHAFKHAKDFGVNGNPSKQTLADFAVKIKAHVAAPTTRAISGFYRNRAVTHYLDPATGLNVIQSADGRFLSAWKLGAQQLKHVLETGNLGGGP
jgi:hypothetical protein